MNPRFANSLERIALRVLSLDAAVRRRHGQRLRDLIEVLRAESPRLADRFMHFVLTRKEREETT